MRVGSGASTDPFCLSGVDYLAREMYNELQEVEYYTGELNEEEFERYCWRAVDLQPLAGGHIFEAKVAGTGYTHCRAAYGYGDGAVCWH